MCIELTARECKLFRCKYFELKLFTPAGTLICTRNTGIQICKSFDSSLYFSRASCFLLPRTDAVASAAGAAQSIVTDRRVAAYFPQAVKYSHRCCYSVVWFNLRFYRGREVTQMCLLFFNRTRFFKIECTFINCTRILFLFHAPI